MSRTRTLIRGGAQSSLSVFVGMAALLVVGKILAQKLSIEEVGVFGGLLAASDFLVVLLGLGIPAALPKLLAEREGNAQDRSLQAAVLGTASISFLGCAAILAGWYCIPHTVFPGAKAWDFARAAWPFAWQIPVLMAVGLLREVLMAALAGLGRYRARSIAQVTVSIGQIMLVGAALLAIATGLNGVLIAMSAAHALGIGMMLRHLPGLRNARFSRSGFIECVRFSWPLYVNSLLTVFYTRLDLLLVGFYLGPYASGLYEMMKRVALLVSRVLGALLVPFLPAVSRALAEDDAATAARWTNRATALAAFIGFGTALSLLSVQEFVIDLLFAGQYCAGTVVLWMLLVSQTLTAQAGIAGLTLIALGRPALVTCSNMVLVAVTLGANAVMLPRLGLAGAGWASLLGIGASLVLQTVLSRRSGLRTEWKALAMPAIALIPALLLFFYAGENLLYRLPVLPCFVILSFALGVITPAQLRNIAAAFRPQGIDITP